MKLKYSKGWSTHNAMLIKTVAESKGKVLEFGAGFFSTPLLHWLCKDLNKKLVTLENNIVFFNFARQFRSRLHSVRYIENWDNFPVNEHWGVILIDHDKPYQRRGTDALKFKGSADFIVLHDTEVEKIYGYDKIWKYFKYRHDWKECRPWTTVVSNFIDLSWLGANKKII